MFLAAVNLTPICAERKALEKPAWLLLVYSSRIAAWTFAANSGGIVSMP